MQQLGHSRVDVAASYYGTHGHKLRGKDNPGMPWDRKARKSALQASQSVQPTGGAPNYAEAQRVAAKVQYSFVLKEPASVVGSFTDEPSEQEAE
jgi:hypothetical protein